MILNEFPTLDYVIEQNIWRPLDLAEFEKFRALLKLQEISIGTPLSPEQFTKLVWELDVDVTIEIDQKAIFAAFEAQASLDLDVSLLNATLYPYQQSGAVYALSSALAGRGVLLADEMGLGKTIQAIYVLAALAKQSLSKTSPSLVVVPSSNLANWIREFSKFSPNLPISLHYGPFRAGVLSSLALADVVLTTYDVVTRDIDFLEDQSWGIVVLDEVQNIKNPESLRSQAAKRLVKSSGLAITGTPIENSLADLWSIFSFIQPSLLGELEDFRFEFPDSTQSASLLSQKIAPFTVRRSVADVAKDLPEKSEFETPIFASPSMSVEYSNLGGDPAISDLAKLTKLRQICASPSHGVENSPKILRLLGLLEEVFAAKNKALIFASFTDSIDGLSAAIRSNFPFVFIDTLDGRKTAQQRQEAIDEFSASNLPGVLIANPKAAGVGLNIQAASYVFHFTPEWNPAQVAQATARVHRRGQVKPVFVYYFYFKDTVEEYMLEILASKRALLREGLSAFDEGQLSKSEISEALSRRPSTN
jgi:SNF2 family DNA or RNA helicase